MYIPREKYHQLILRALGSVPIVALIGCRQVGKTTMMEHLPLEGDKLLLNGQDPDVAALFAQYSNIEHYLQINLNNSLDGYLLIDEFQFIHGISTMLKLLTDRHKKLKVVCTGSSSLDILRETGESLAGRIRMLPVYALSFAEYLSFTDEKLYGLYQKYTSSTPVEVVDKRLPLLMEEYLLFGGLPRVALAKEYEEKIALLDDIYQTYLLKDVRAYVKNEDFVGFNKLLRLVAAQIGNLLNIHELSQASGLAYKKCETYLHLLEQMYIIKLIGPQVPNKRKGIIKAKKVYFFDIGLRNRVYNSFNDMDIRTDNGAIFENFVYLELCKAFPKTTHIYFYRTKDGAEIDFLVDDGLRKLVPVEVKYSPAIGANHLRSLKKFAGELGTTENYLVTKGTAKKESNIQCLPGYLVGKLAEGQSTGLV